ncbi:hypothetical protein [Curtobacterium oceanosedimentum]|nr:hypothetical protein [Curtobacterium oceanosedimentum]
MSGWKRHADVEKGLVEPLGSTSTREGWGILNLSRLLMLLSENSSDDAADSEQIEQVRQCLERAQMQAPTSCAQLHLIGQAARLVADSWPHESDIGRVVLGFASEARSSAR